MHSFLVYILAINFHNKNNKPLFDLEFKIRKEMSPGKK